MVDNWALRGDSTEPVTSVFMALVNAVDDQEGEVRGVVQFSSALIRLVGGGRVVICECPCGAGGLDLLRV